MSSLVCLSARALAQEPAPPDPGISATDTGPSEDAADTSVTGPTAPGSEEEAGAGPAEGRLLEEAEASLAELRFDAAIRLLTDALAAIGESPGDVARRRLRCRALDLRAQALLSLGKQEEAGRDFEALVRTDPAYQLDALTVSPKIIQRFQKIREGMIGFASVTCDPAATALEIDGWRAGACPLIDHPLLSGEHTLVASHEGFDALEVPFAIETGGSEQLNVSLVPNVRRVVLRTVPAGIEVLLDGDLAGTTQPGEGGQTGPSAPLLLEAVPPGEHRFTFRKPCWIEQVRSFAVVVDLLDRSPIVLETVEMEPALGALSVGSDPIDARVLVDGRPVGQTPLADHPTCAGDRAVEVQFNGGVSWRETISLRPGEQKTLVAHPRPDLRVTLRTQVEAIAHLPGEERAGLVRALAGSIRALKNFNVMVDGDEAGPRRERPAPGNISTEVEDDPLLELEVDIRAGTIEPVRRISIGSAFHGRPERWELSLEDERAWRAFLSDMDTPLRFRSLASGLVLVDTLITKGPVVVSVRSGSPAARAGFAPGDEIRSVDGRPPPSAGELREMLKRPEGAAPVQIELHRPAGARRLKLSSTAAPALIPLNRPASPKMDGERFFSYHKAAVESAVVARVKPVGPERSIALLNLAVALLHFGEDARALREALLRVDLPDGAGVSRATALYLAGCAYERLGMNGEAAAAFSKAAASTEATLSDLEGVPLAAWARLRQGNLRRAP
jgi:tetratricopeptide (TPR) repeat protein